MPVPIKLGLAKPKAAPAKVSRPSAFGDDDDGPVRGPTASTSKLPPPANATLSRAQKKAVDQAKELDASVYEYDEVYDYLKEGERQAEKERAKENAERKVVFLFAFY